MCGWAVGGTVGCRGMSWMGSVGGSVGDIGSNELVSEGDDGTVVGSSVGSSMGWCRVRSCVCRLGEVWGRDGRQVGVGV